jgi:hypothetical protein
MAAESPIRAALQELQLLDIGEAAAPALALLASLVEEQEKAHEALRLRVEDLEKLLKKRAAFAQEQ